MPASRILGRRYDTGEPISVTIADERIARIDPATPSGRLADWPYLAPAFFDLQINGYGGVWFSQENLAADDVLKALTPFFRYGVSRLCPTLITNSYEALASGFAAIRKACEQEKWANQMIPGCHLEGPYIASEDGPRGAHPLMHVRPADWQEFTRLQEVSGHRIRLITLAAESPGACDFIRKAVASNVVVSIGHTAANSEQIAAAVDAGARLSTHLGNGAHGTLRRHPNYIWDQLGDPRLSASLIVDGHHIPPSVIRSVVRTKGVRGTIITCDASGLAGCPPGRYTSDAMDVEILDDGRIVLAGQRQILAGSTLKTDACVAHMRAAAQVSLRDACDMAGRNPARLLGFEEIALRRGSRADLIQFDVPGSGDRFQIHATWMAGRLRHGSAISN